MSNRTFAQKREAGGAEPAAGSQQDAHIANSPAMLAQRRQLQDSFGDAAQLMGPQDEELQAKAEPAPNRTGMPDSLKNGIESLSGMDMSDVRVHAGSARPAQLNALAYAQGNDIHLGPGQEKHLAHEAWHVVQQRQGRVQATQDVAGTAVNDDPGLEQEADQMGNKATQLRAEPGTGMKPQEGAGPSQPRGEVAQRVLFCYMRADVLFGEVRGPFEDEIIAQVIYQRPSSVPYTGSDGSNTGSTKHYVPHHWILKNLIDWHIEGKSRKQAAFSLSLVLAKLKIQPPALPREALAASYNLWVDEVVTSICDWQPNLFKDVPSSTDHGGSTLDTPSDPAVLLRVQAAAAAYGDLANKPLS
ncbi:DUF4157 domain-containing protein [Ramlibacter sp. WS9]|uniref:eCIS core domain-containing protein n=1 Tax=Ramlibacter sp. WS9 TaxID=1882741 RepID=UPI001144FC76|nr:DUF4157 domain-containing protein [Ramlibacter sp. WS9]ROZ72680.1 DUF4157 domain-containing protein [Ramlibacter sp. WS9]